MNKCTNEQSVTDIIDLVIESRGHIRVEIINTKIASETTLTIVGIQPGEAEILFDNPQQLIRNLEELIKGVKEAVETVEE